MKEIPTASSATAESSHRCWLGSSIVWAGSAGLALLYSFWLSGVIHHTPGWFQADDVWNLIDAGRYVWNGALGFVYQGTGSYALPLSFILSAPVAGLMDTWHLVEGAPYPVATPSAWVVVAPYTTLYWLPFLVLVRRSAWDLGLRSGLAALQVACVPLVIVPAFFWGHPEDVMALTFLIAATRRVLRSDWVAAGLFLSLAVSSKQWAVMVIPLLITMGPPGRRIRVTVAACALPAVFTVLVLGADWSDASKALFAPVTLSAHSAGHLSFFAHWLGGRTSQVSRTLGTCAAIPLGLLLGRRSRQVPQVLAVAVLLLVVRPLAEPIGYSYYWTPALLFAGLVSVAAHRRFRLRDWSAPIAAVIWATPRSNPATDAWWWAGELFLLAVVSFQVLRNCGVEFRVPAALAPSVKKVRPRPILQPMTAAHATGETSWNR